MANLAKQLAKDADLRIELYDSLLDFLREGYEAPMALEKIAKSYDGDEDQIEVRLSSAMDDLVAAGVSFNEALASFLPGDESVLVRSAPVDQAEIALQNAIEIAKTQRYIKKELRSRLLSVSGSLIMVIIMLLGAGLYFFPVMEKMMPIESWPSWVVGVYHVCSTSVYWLPMTFVYLVSVVLLSIWSLPRVTPVREYLDYFPVAKSIKSNYQSMLVSLNFTVLSALILSRLDVKECVDIVRGSDPREYVKAQYDRIEDLLNEYELSNALAQSEMVSKDLKPVVRRYADLPGSLGEKLNRLAAKTTQDSREQLDAQLSQILTLSNTFSATIIALVSVSTLSIAV